MSRRGGPGLQVLIGVVVVGLFLYGFYSYHEVQSRLRTMEEKADRFKVEHESVSAQLQVVYEHKSRLEKTVQEEKTLHKKTKDDLNEKTNLEQRMRQEKETLTQELDRVKSERDRYEDEKNKVESEKQHAEEELRILHDSCEKQNEIHLQQINQQRQECDNDVAQFKDEIADLRRRNGDLEAKVMNQSLGLKPGSMDALDAARRNKTRMDEERQNVMQIAEPGENKQKGYFEVKSPAPVDKKLVEAQLQQQDQKEQVAPPVVKDPEAGDNDKQVADVNANQVPNNEDNRIQDIRAVKKSEDDNLGDNGNVIDRIPGDNVVNEPLKDEKNIVPGQVPPPASKDENRPAAAAYDKQKEEDIPDQVAKPNEDVAPGQVAKPGQDNLPGQVNPPGEGVKPLGNDRHVAKIPDEDDIEEDEQAPNEGQQGNPEAKKNAENEEEEYEENQENNAKDM